MSLVAVYAPTKMCEANKEMFDVKLDSDLDQCRHQDTLIVLNDFNAAIGTERADCSYVLVTMALVPGTPTALFF